MNRRIAELIVRYPIFTLYVLACWCMVLAVDALVGAR